MSEIIEDRLCAEGSIAILNPVGTAPAFIAYIRKSPVICLPGVPRELEYLLHNDVLPWLKKQFMLEENKITTGFEDGRYR